MDEEFEVTKSEFMYTVVLSYIKCISEQLSKNIIVDDRMLELMKKISIAARDHAYTDSVNVINESKEISKKEYFKTYGEKIDEMSVEMDAALVLSSSSEALIESWTMFDSYLKIMDLPK